MSNVNTIAARNKRIKELEAEVERLHSINQITLDESNRRIDELQRGLRAQVERSDTAVSDAEAAEARVAGLERERDAACEAVGAIGAAATEAEDRMYGRFRQAEIERDEARAKLARAERLAEVAILINCPCCNSRLMIPTEEGASPIDLTHGYNDRPLALPSWSLGDLITLILVGTSIIALIVIAAVSVTGGSF